MSKEPTFDEGPFFLVEGTTGLGLLSRKALVWTADPKTAQHVFYLKEPSSLYAHEDLVGDLATVKEKYKLSRGQVIDLHREGYLKL